MQGFQQGMTTFTGNCCWSMPWYSRFICLFLWTFGETQSLFCQWPSTPTLVTFLRSILFSFRVLSSFFRTIRFVQRWLDYDSKRDKRSWFFFFFFSSRVHFVKKKSNCSVQPVFRFTPLLCRKNSQSFICVAEDNWYSKRTHNLLFPFAGTENLCVGCLWMASCKIDEWMFSHLLGNRAAVQRLRRGEFLAPGKHWSRLAHRLQFHCLRRTRRPCPHRPAEAGFALQHSVSHCPA